MLIGTFSSRFEKKLAKYKAEQVKTAPVPLAKSFQPCVCGHCKECDERRLKARDVIAKGAGPTAGVKLNKFSTQDAETLRQIYQDIKYDNNAFKRAQKVLAHHSPSEIFRQAAEQNLIRTRERFRWSDAELGVVEAFAHCSLEAIQRRLAGVSPKGCKRTRAAIASQIHALKFRSNLDGMHSAQLAEALGVSHYTIQQWRGQGLIEAHQLPSLDLHKDKQFRGGTAPWFYHNQDVFVFLLTYPRLYDFRRVNQQWYTDMMKYGLALDAKVRNQVLHA